MSWTVACFCGTVFEPPPDRCPTCASHVPAVHTGRIDNEPRRPGATVLPTGFDSLERELSKLASSPVHSTR